MALQLCNGGDADELLLEVVPSIRHGLLLPSMVPNRSPLPADGQWDGRKRELRAAGFRYYYHNNPSSRSADPGRFRPGRCGSDGACISQNAAGPQQREDGMVSRKIQSVGQLHQSKAADELLRSILTYCRECHPIGPVVEESNSRRSWPSFPSAPSGGRHVPLGRRALCLPGRSGCCRPSLTRHRRPSSARSR